MKKTGGWVLASFLILPIFILGGCGSVAPTPGLYDFSSQPKNVFPEVPKDKALVYFYRLSRYKESSVTFYVWEGEDIIGGLKSGSYFYYMAKPGRHLFWTKTEDKSVVSLDLKPGNTYYIIAKVKMGMWTGVPKLTVVPKSMGSEDVKVLTYSTLRDSLDKINVEYVRGRLKREPHETSPEY